MNKEHEGKERTTLWFSPGGIRRCDAAAKLDGCKSRSDFVERAVNFYAGFISAQNHTDFFATVISEMVSSTIAGTERRLARMDFKLAVELAKLSHILASQCDIDDEQLRRLHIRCVEEVKRINGVVRFDDAVEYQHDE